jgi:ABC-type lipoprotein release transport system permease subunit
MGTLAGLAGAVAASRYVESILFGVSATDPIAITAAAGILMATVLAACYLPARRAARLDPTQTLRSE